MNDALSLLLDEIASRVADELERRGLVAVAMSPATCAEQLVTIDELIELLPPGRSWRKWLYAHAPGGDVPGATKIAGRWYFRRDETLAALGASKETSLPPSVGPTAGVDSRNA